MRRRLPATRKPPHGRPPRASCSIPTNSSPATDAMNPFEHAVHLTRRDFFTTTANGLGILALGSMLNQDRLFAGAEPLPGAEPLQPKAPHFAPKAKNCIF